MKLVREHIIFEKFTEDSDPIHDLGIGLKGMLKKEVEKLDEMDFEELSNYFYGDYAHLKHGLIIFRMLYFYLKENKKFQQTFKEEVEYSKVLQSKKSQMCVINALKEKYGIIVEPLPQFYHDKKINEKFTEKGDPILDMGIGLKSVWKNLKSGDIIRVKKKIIMCSSFFQDIYPVGSYFLIISVEDERPKDKEIYYRYYKTKEDLETNNPTTDEDYWTWDFKFFKEFFEKIGEKDISESINEKFTKDDSDPIRDMGIGSITVRLYPHMNTEDGKFVTFLSPPNKYALAFEKYLKDNYITYRVISDSTTGNWPPVHFTGTKADLIKMIEETSPFKHCVYNIKHGYETMETMLKVVSVNEKFTEDDSDPIHDMGIGGYSFETLRPGAIIKSKRTGIAVTHNKNGQFTSWYTGMMLQTDKSILITKIEDWGDTGKYKRIYFIKFYKPEFCTEYRNNFTMYAETPYPSSAVGRSNNMIVSKLMFNNRFEIIERGF